MPTVAQQDGNRTEIAVVKKIKDYSKEPFFREKAEKAVAFLKKRGLPKAFQKKSK